MVLETIPQLLTAAECRNFIEWGELDRYQSTSRDYPDSYRNNDRLVADRPELAKQMFLRLRHRLPRQLYRLGRAWKLQGLNPRFRGCRYRDGQSFSRHRDGAHSPDQHSLSFLTVMLYLNDAKSFTGGGTRFYADRYSEETERVVTPQTGLAILFSHDYWHDGEAVTQGTKYVLRTDVIYRTDQPQSGGHRGYVWTLEALSDGRLLSGSRDKTIKVWSKNDGLDQPTQTLQHHKASVTCLLETGQGFVSGSRDRQLVWWRESSSGFRPVHQKNAHLGAVLCLARQGSGDLLSGGADGFLRRWDRRGRLLSEIQLDGWVWCLEPTESGLLCGTESGRILHLDFDLGRPQTLYRGKTPILSLASERSGGFLAGTGDGQLLVFGEDRELLATRPGHRGAVTALVRTSDHGLVSGGEDDGVRLWEQTGGRWESELLHEHSDFVRALCLTESGELVSASYDGTLRSTLLGVPA